MRTAICLFFTVTLFLSCSDDEKVSPKDKMINQITESTWVVEQVEHGTDGDLTFQYTDFSLAFTASGSGDFIGEYFVGHGGYAFPDAFGKWNLSADLKNVLFDNDQEFAVEFVGERMLLDFTVNPPDGGRVEGLSGHFTFTLKHIP